MEIDVTIKIGGEAGQGIQTVGQLLAMTCQQAGLYVMGINDFESRIRGGHSFFQIRISDKTVRAPHHNVHLLVAMDPNTLELHKEEVLPDGLIITDEEKPGGSGHILRVPFAGLAQKAGSSITANTVAAGATLALLGAPFRIFEEVLKKQFEGKNRQVAEQNLRAAKLGFEAVSDFEFNYSFNWKPGDHKGMLIDGSQSIALGALAGDCRFVAFYPMSPATSIMLHLASFQNRFPLVVEQAEDEIAAVNMIIGASFAGARSITATSGGGFCLMTEGLGYAGIAEIPIVIINAQRPGPATGLPTRTAQGDLQFVIRAAQDDFPCFVFAPGSPEEAFATSARALNLAEKYQVPAIILTDQFLNDSFYILDNRFKAPENIDYFVEASGDDEKYRRYVLTPSGISPRALPCQGKSLVVCSGNEHSEDGHISESAENRNSMVKKRVRKQAGMLAEMRLPEKYHADANVLLVGWGSTAGIIKEAVDMMRDDNIDAGSLHFCDLWPFPAKAAEPVLRNADRFYVVECNSTGQFAQLLRQETGLQPAGNILKYDGRPFYPLEIYKSVKQMLV